MFFTLDELVRWLGLTVFEMWVNLISIFIFTIFLVLNYNPEIDVAGNNWKLIFFPLFSGDVLNTYFCTIIFIRMMLETTFKVSFLRMIWNAFFLVSVIMFKVLLYNKLRSRAILNYSEVFAPVFVLLLFIALRACQQN